MNIVIMNNNRLFLESTAEVLRQSNKFDNVYHFHRSEINEMDTFLLANPIDLLLLEINAEDIDLAKRIKKENPRLLLGFITKFPNLKNLRKHAIELGADAFFSKNLTPKEMMHFVQEMLDGEKPGITYEVVCQNRLSENENNVLHLLCKGKTTQQIAEELFMPSSQVERHRVSIFEKFEVTDEQEAIKKAKELGHVVN